MESFAGSRIGPSMQIAGEIAWRGSLQVAGTCQGSLTGGDLVIESDGQVSGVVEVDNLDCAGSLQGQVVASSCTLRRGACQSGRVTTCQLSLEPGAALDIISPGDASRLPSAEAALLPQTEVP
jgi:cytoskeletal protein CcmA (bactofilin family)